MKNRNSGEAAGRLLRVPDAADRLAVCERILWTWIRDGRLPAVRLGRSTRIRESDIDNLVRTGLPRRRVRS